MLNDKIMSNIRRYAQEFLGGNWESPLSIGKIREFKKLPIFTLLCDTSGRIVFLCVGMEAEYKSLRGYAIPYSLPTEKGWGKGTTKEEQEAVKKACNTPFILLFLDQKGVIEHLLLNPTGAILWAARFCGWNEIQPHLELFDSVDDIRLF